MRVGLGARYAAYFSLLTLAVVGSALAAAGLLAFRRTHVLQREIRDAIVASQSAEAETALKGAAAYLSGRLFNPAYQLDVERLAEEIEQVRIWLPVHRFEVSDGQGHVLTDGTPENRRYGEKLEGPLPAGAPWGPLLERREGSVELRFAIREGQTVAGWAVLVLGEDALHSSLRSIESGTGRLWTGYLSSLVYLAAAVLGLTLLLGGLISARVSRTLAQPLRDMGEVAARLASGQPDEPLQPSALLAEQDELGELARALNRMALDLRSQEAALRVERDLVSRLMETSPVAILRLDAGQRIRFANPRAETLLRLRRADPPDAGYLAPEWRLLRDDGSPLPPEEGPLALAARERRSIFGAQQEIAWPDGTPMTLSISATPLQGPQSEFDGVVASVEDVTRARLAELERERLIADLEGKNAELERFNYTVSHDLKSPLVTIQGFAGLIEADLARGAEDRVKANLARIASASHTMRRLLDDLLELSRIGRVVSPPEPVALAELARETVELLRGSLDRRGVSVRVDPALPVVRGDRRRLQEVLQNLLENAVKFMGSQPRPQVEIGWRNDGGPERPIYVRDNGQGLERRHVTRVFRLFEKLDPRAEGTGVGLALVRRIVEAHGGRTWAESAGSGQGSTFYFTLPLEP
ncbi:MAG: ATP-binding protein [Vicinamibacteria bacterium]